MYKNNFDEAFDSACKAPEYAGFVRSRRINFCVKWAVYAALWGISALIVYYANGGKFPGMDSGVIAVLALTALFLTWIYSVFFPKFGKFRRSGKAFCSLLLNVLNGCFDEEIGVSEAEVDRAEYEKSSPEERYRDFNTAFFTAADFGINVKTHKAEINVYDVIVSEKDTNRLPGGFDNSAATEMIFAAARFPNAAALSPDNYSIKKYLALRPEKIYVSSYGDTLYIEIDCKSFSINGMTGKSVRRKCLNICENISLILGIVERA